MGRKSTEPVAWINTNANRRVFYTSLGGPEDFKDPAFRRLLLKRDALELWTSRSRRPELAAPTGRRKFESDWQPLRVPGTWEDNSEGALARL